MAEQVDMREGHPCEMCQSFVAHRYRCSNCGATLDLCGDCEVPEGIDRETVQFFPCAVCDCELVMEERTGG